MKTTDEHIEVLQTLLSRNVDSIKGFKGVAEKTSSEQLQTFCHMNILEREGFISDLGQRIQELGGSPNDDLNFDAYLHRKWIDFKSLLNHDSKDEIIGECKRGEETMISDYMEAASSHKLDSKSKKIIVNQLKAIQMHEHHLEQIK